jgi:hypothetical protein
LALPADYWSNYEVTVGTLAAYIDLVATLTATWPTRRFVWRGVSTAGYALHSSLYRAALDLRGADVREEDLAALEMRVVREARQWSLQRTATDRLSALELLAALQHQNVPTRLLDFSHNALVGLWFAVEQKYDDEGRPRPDLDGRVFIAQANGRDVADDWPRDADLPWASSAPDDWKRDIYIWTPPPIDPRMARHQGCFLLAGVPSTPGSWNLSPAGGGQLRAPQIRECVSVPVRLNSPHYLSHDRARGRRPGYPLAFTIRVPAAAKRELRTTLQVGFGYTHAMMYPDYPGFAKFGRSFRPD